MRSLLSLADLDEQLSQPTQGVLDTLRVLEGDVMVLGAGGKMGPTLARMIRRALDALGQKNREVIAVSRFSSPEAQSELSRHGVRTLACDLLNAAEVDALPEVPNILFMAGQKFGTHAAPGLTWVMNTTVPSIVAQRFARSRIVVFSTGCVYPLTSVEGLGSSERDALGPPGEYGNSCVGRERIFEYHGQQQGTPMLFYRLSYAIDLRYGVLMDVAQKVAQGEPVDVTMGYVNVIWQGDANARAIQCLAHTTVPPIALNVTGLERVSIRELAKQFGEIFQKPVTIIGSEAPTAWLFDASLSNDWFGPPTVSLEEMIRATADWVSAGGVTNGKPTHFQARDGQF